MRRRLSLALATLMLFVRVPTRRSAGAIARRVDTLREGIRHLRRIIGGTIGPRLLSGRLSFMRRSRRWRSSARR